MFFIQYIQRHLRKLAQPQSAEEANIYILLDELEGQIARKHLYVLANLKYEVMGIVQS